MNARDALALVLDQVDYTAGACARCNERCHELTLAGGLCAACAAAKKAERETR